MKELKKLQVFALRNCFMTLEILAQILDAVAEFLETQPDIEGSSTFEFNQANSKKFLENDETRQILYEFLMKLEKEIDFQCRDEVEPMTDWYKKQDGTVLLKYVNQNGDEIEFIPQ